MSNELDSAVAPISMKMAPEDAAQLKALGESSASNCLRDWLSRRLAQVRQENDNLEGKDLTRSQGKALMIVELKKLLGYE